MRTISWVIPEAEAQDGALRCFLVEHGIMITSLLEPSEVVIRLTIILFARFLEMVAEEQIKQRIRKTGRRTAILEV